MFRDDAERLYFVCRLIAAADGHIHPREDLATQRHEMGHDSWPGPERRDELDAAATSRDRLAHLQAAFAGAGPEARSHLLMVAENIARADGVLHRAEVLRMQQLVDTLRVVRAV